MYICVNCVDTPLVMVGSPVGNELRNLNAIRFETSRGPPSMGYIHKFSNHYSPSFRYRRYIVV